MEELKPKIVRLVTEENVPAVESYIAHFQRVTGQLRALIYRASCPQLVKYNGVSWFDKKKEFFFLYLRCRVVEKLN